MNEKVKAYRRKRKKLCIKQVNIEFNINNSDDKELLDKLNKCDNKQGFIKKVLRDSL